MNDHETRTREAKLDRMLADSFPASDPPSFTPVMGVGGWASEAQRIDDENGDAMASRRARGIDR